MDCKVCTECGQEKPGSEFLYYKDKRCKSGYRDRSDCRDCYRQSVRLYHQRTSKSPPDVTPHLPDALKVCPRCKVAKSYDQFGPNPQRKDGVAVYCQPCTRAYGVENREPRVIDGVTVYFCSTCRERKPESDMVKGRKHQCKACWASYMNEWYAKSLGRALRARALLMPEDGLIAMTCTKCKVFRPVVDFYYKGRRYLRKCKHCHHKDNRTYLDAHREEHRKQSRERRYQNRYGLTYADKVAMFKSREGRCDICQCDLGTVRDAHLDHCHADGRVRGLLCRNCNRGIGELKDDPAIMRRAIEYVTRLT